MKKLNETYIKLLCLIMLVFFAGNYNMAFSAAATVTKAPAAKTQQVSPAAIMVKPSEVVKNPAKYLNKTITFNAEFIAFSSLGLDYKPAFRDSAKYIGVLIQRDDVCDNVIPLSEMKIFLTREIAEKNVDLEQGDKIKITGKVFSNALGDPWVDIQTFTVLTQKNKTNNK